MHGPRRRTLAGRAAGQWTRTGSLSLLSLSTTSRTRCLSELLRRATRSVPRVSTLSPPPRPSGLTCRTARLGLDSCPPSRRRRLRQRYVYVHSGERKDCRPRGLAKGKRPCRKILKAICLPLYPACHATPSKRGDRKRQLSENTLGAALTLRGSAGPGEAREAPTDPLSPSNGLNRGRKNMCPGPEGLMCPNQEAGRGRETQLRRAQRALSPVALFAPAIEPACIDSPARPVTFLARGAKEDKQA